jgi:1-acyl-sn-glycerol-3-phosphate acyltransferase
MNLYYRVGYWIVIALAKFLLKHKAYGRENLIESGPVILAANHQSYLDPPLIGICCRREIFVLTRRTLFKMRVVGWLISKLNTVPVDRERGDLSAFKSVVRLLNSGQGVLIFPEGTRSVDGRLQSARAGLGMLIAKTSAPVIPVRIFGTHEALPKTGGLKLHPITVVIGKPIRFGESELQSDTRELYQRLSDRVMAEIAGLRLPPERAGRSPKAGTLQETSSGV